MFIETEDQAVARSRSRRHTLRKGEKAHRRVARILKKCKSGHHCGTEACRTCLRDFRIWWTGEAAKIMVQKPAWTRCSIIPAGLLVPCGHLAEFDLSAEIKRIRKRIQRSEVHGRILLGALDLSLNLEHNEPMGWQWHVYLIVEGEDDRALRKSIKKIFPAEPSALVPYDIEQIRETDYLEVITYAYKAHFKRRSGYNDSKGNHQTKDQPLKGNEERELLSFLARHKIGARLILSGVRRNGQRLLFTA